MQSTEEVHPEQHGYPISAVTVYAGSGANVPTVFREHAFLLGKLIAENSWVQVNGGGSTGLMGASTEGGHAAGGIVDSVILRIFLADNAHTLIRKQFVCDTLPDRKKGLFERGDAIIALPGGLGTLDELAEDSCTRQLNMHQKPIVVVNTNGFFNGLRDFIQNAIQDKFISPTMNKAIYFADDPHDAIRFLKQYQSFDIDKKAISSGEMKVSSAQKPQVV